jgi:hypothetical protein
MRSISVFAALALLGACGSQVDHDPDAQTPHGADDAAATGAGAAPASGAGASGAGASAASGAGASGAGASAASGTSAAGGAPSSTSVAAGGSAGSSASGGQGGAGATGGLGGEGGSLPCVPASVDACYDGPPGTQGVGVCTAGQRVCLDDGSGFGPCQAQVLPGIEDCATSIDEDCTPTTCPVPLEWATGVGEVTQHAFGRGVAVDGGGNIVVVGTWEALPLDLGGPPLPAPDGTDGFVVKLDADGNHLWSRAIGGPEDSYAQHVVADDEGNIFVAGITTGEVVFEGSSLGAGNGYVLKLDPDGALLWSKMVGGGSGRIALHPSGDLVTSGTFLGSLTIGGVALGSAFADEAPDTYLARLDGATGAVVWSAVVPVAGQQQADAVDVAPQGDVMVSGISQVSPIDLGAGPVGPGGVMLFGTRHDGAGNLVATRTFGIASWGSYALTAATPSGGFVWGGQTDALLDLGGGPLGGFSDAYLASWSPAGALQWSRDFAPNLGQSRVTAVSVDAGGDIAIGGNFTNVIDFGLGPLTTSVQALAGFVTRLDAQGNALWSAMLGTDNATEIYDLAFTPAGHVVIVGRLLGEVDFWGTTVTGAGGGSLLIAKLGP